MSQTPEPTHTSPAPERHIYGRPRSTSTMLESKLETRFRDSVRKYLGGRTYKLIATEKGIPDRMVCLPNGIIHLVELKTEAGRLNPAQVLWHARAAELGTYVHVIYGPEGLEEWLAARRADQAN